VYKAYKFRIYPTEEQKILINKTIGCTRFVYNHFFALWEDTYKTTGKGLSYNKCSAILPSLKKYHPWLEEVDSISLQSSIKSLQDAYNRFFAGQNGKPQFKKKYNLEQSYTTKLTNNNIRIEGNKVKLPKLGYVKFAKSREVNGKIVNVTVRRKPTGKYYISILVDEQIEPLEKTGSSCGVDVGLKDFAVVSDGTVYDNPKYFRKLEKKLAKEQRKLSRRKERAKQCGVKLSEAKNYQKQKLKVARLHEKIKNKRNDYLHKVSTEIVKNHDIIGMENLQVKNMQKNRNLSKAISDVSWSKFKGMVEYKAKWYGKELVTVAKNFPSSQLCSTPGCSYRNKAVKDLSIRTWQCPECGVTHDRDFNASKNLEVEAIRLQTAGTAGIA